MNKDELIDYCKEASQTISELDYKNRILEKENQELKKKYENAVEKLSEQLELLTSKLDEYDLIVDERNQLKKQLEEKIKIGVADHKYSSQCEDKVITMETQQQEFIKYLEDETKEVEKTIEMLSDTNSCRIQNLKYKGNTLKEILQKYKEIIGENDV